MQFNQTHSIRFSNWHPPPSFPWLSKYFTNPAAQRGRRCSCKYFKTLKKYFCIKFQCLSNNLIAFDDNQVHDLVYFRSLPSNTVTYWGLHHIEPHFPLNSFEIWSICWCASYVIGYYRTYDPVFGVLLLVTMDVNCW